MTPDEIRKLLGGFATGTLTEQERRVLFSAALEDQALFDALANEEALREFLAEPGNREELLDELGRGQENGGALEGNDRWAPAPVVIEAMMAPPPTSRLSLKQDLSVWHRFWGTVTPRRFAVAGGLAVVVLAMIGIPYVRRAAAPEKPVELAMTKAPEPREPATAQNETQPAPSVVRPQRVEPPAQSAAQPPSPRADQFRDTAGLEKLEKERQTPAPREDSDQIAQNRLAAAPPPITPEKVQDERALNAAAEPKAAAPADQLSAAEGAGSPAAGRSRALPLASRLPLGNLRSIPSLNGRITDVNGTIVSINLGTNAGLKTGDTLEIVREGRLLGTVKLTEAAATFAVGPVQPANAGPRVGDSVRRPLAALPAK